MSRGKPKTTREGSGKNEFAATAEGGFSYSYRHLLSDETRMRLIERGYGTPADHKWLAKKRAEMNRLMKLAGWEK